MAHNENRGLLCVKFYRFPYWRKILHTKVKHLSKIRYCMTLPYKPNALSVNEYFVYIIHHQRIQQNWNWNWNRNKHVNKQHRQLCTQSVFDFMSSEFSEYIRRENIRGLSILSIGKEKNSTVGYTVSDRPKRTPLIVSADNFAKLQPISTTFSLNTVRVLAVKGEYNVQKTCHLHFDTFKTLSLRYSILL